MIAALSWEIQSSIAPVVRLQVRMPRLDIDDFNEMRVLDEVRVPRLG